MNNKLETNFKTQKQSFEIANDEIRVHLDTAKHKLKYNIPIADAKNIWHITNGGLDKATARLYSSIFLNISLILCIITLVNKTPIVAIQIIALVCFVAFIFLLKHNNDTYEEKHIESSKLFYFIYTKKNAIEVDNFIDLIFKKQVEYFRKEYFQIDPVLPHNIQADRYIWLYTSKYITENEYEVIREDLDKFFNFNTNI